MNWLWILFGFKGRINRAKFWLGTVVSYLAFTAVFVLGGIIGAATGFEPTKAVMWNVLGLVVLFTGFALTAKRLHDRGKSGWWMLVFFVLPLVLQSMAPAGIPGVLAMIIAGAISIWALIELGFVEGTGGPNAYGPDPLRTA